MEVVTIVALDSALNRDLLDGRDKRWRCLNEICTKEEASHQHIKHDTSIDALFRGFAKVPIPARGNIDNAQPYKFCESLDRVLPRNVVSVLQAKLD